MVFTIVRRTINFMSGYKKTYPEANKPIAMHNLRQAEPELLRRRLLREYFDGLAWYQYEEVKIAIEAAEQAGFYDLALEMKKDSKNE